MASELLAKSNGVTLVEHSRNVAEKAKALAKDLGLDEELCDVVHLAGLCHDIGKADSGFQQHIKNNSDETHGEDIVESDAKYALHNEIGWAYLCKNGFRYQPKSIIKDSNIGILIQNTTYWHHGAVSHKHIDEYGDIGSILEDVDCTNLDLISDELKISDYFCGYAGNNDTRRPTYISKKPDKPHYNALQFIIRACVVGADRYVSAKERGEQLETVFEITSIHKNRIKVPNSYNPERFKKTYEIAEQALLSQITQINAPAGLGKTMIGVIVHALKGGHTYWVVPRNTIAESLYESITEEVRALGLDIGVELFLTGDVVKTTGNPSITITNIDNLMAPITTMKRAEMAYYIFKDTVIFDEYHEFAQKENGIYSAFINIMIARGSVVNGNTILLSATPCVHNEIWNHIISITTEKHFETQILPINGSFYNAAHNRTYSVNVDVPFVKKQDCLTVHNSVKNVQNEYDPSDQRDCRLFHSKYTAKHKSELLTSLLKERGKKSENTDSRWIASPILQASIDISFETLNESILSPESTMQRIGRCNRWGKKEHAYIIINIEEDNKSNAKAIDTLYNKELNKDWYNFVKANFVGEKTLDEMYKLYGEFNKQKKDDLLNYYKELYSSSTKALSALVPLKYHVSAQKDEKNRIISSKNPTLRSLIPNLFYTITDKETEEWLSEPLTMSKLKLEKIQKEGKQNTAIMRNGKQILNGLIKAGYSTFETIRDKKLGKERKTLIQRGELNEKGLKPKAFFSDTPYPVVLLEYAFSKDENGDRRGIIEKE